MSSPHRLDPGPPVVDARPPAPDAGGPGSGARTLIGARRPVLIAALVVVVLLLTAIVAYQHGAAGTPSATPTRAVPTPTPSRSPTVSDVYTALAPSVVSIDARRPGLEATGTGVVVNADATILTALHVVKGASAIQIVFADGTESAAVVATADATRDIATLIPATLPSVVVPAVLGGGLAVGAPVIAIGNPLGLTRTTTTGIVSGLDRAATNPDGVTLSGLIQFDAAVNPGSSGGPLLDARGQIVGIVVALANPTPAGTFIGIGFAVPIGAAVAGGGRPPQK